MTKAKTHYVADTENNVPKRKLYQDRVSNVFGSEPDELDTIDRLDDPDGISILESKNDTRVWGAALCPAREDARENDVTVTPDLQTFFDALVKLRNSPCVWFHNLAYDGPLLLSHLISMGYTPSEHGKPMTEQEEIEIGLLADAGKDVEATEMKTKIDERARQGWKRPDPGTFTTTISEDGVWYCMKFTDRRSRVCIEFRDSLKILPFSVDVVSKALGTSAKKLVGSIDYTKHRPVGYVMTDVERDYIVNDVLVMAQALGMLGERETNLLDHLTIGAACMSEYYKTLGNGDAKVGKDQFRYIFPEISDEDDLELRKAYRGGFCYVHAGKDIVDLRGTGKTGTVSDVNSLYPSVMYNNKYPVGDPVERDADSFEGTRHSYEYIVKVEVDFTLKEGYIPFVQVKGSIWQENEHLTSSEGLIELTFTRPEYELFLEHHDIAYSKPLRYWTFSSTTSAFTEYIDYWYEMKRTATNPVDRMIAKLMLNNLYGKMAQGKVRNGGAPYLDEDGVLRYEMVEGSAEGGHIATGAYITAYAKAVTVRAAQANYDNFLYADTDSIHIVGEPADIAVGKGLGEWDLEAHWDIARYVRQKTYVERLITDTGTEIDLKAAGAPQAVKTRLQYKVTEYRDGEWVFFELEKDDQDNIISERRDDYEVIERFTEGLVEAGKLRRKMVSGGPILEETTFTIHHIDGQTKDPYTGLYR